MSGSNSPSTTYMSPRALAFLVPNLLGSPPKTFQENRVKTCSFDNSQPADFETKKSCDSVLAELLCRDLWLEFHAIGTEMIITKAGRRMFPSLKLRLTGLADDTPYLVYVQMDLVDNKRYRYVYQSSKWVPGGPGDIPFQNQRYFHPDGIQLGRYWKTQSCVSFDKLKLTNSRMPTHSDLISLHSMHRYQPKICIVPISEGWKNSKNIGSFNELLNGYNDSLCFTFPETSFITVTAYQNQQITKLKIASNPFAKGFRESSKEPRELDSRDVSHDSHPKRQRLDLHQNRGAPVEINCLWDLSQHPPLDPMYFWWMQQFSIFQPLLTFPACLDSS